MNLPKSCLTVTLLFASLLAVSGCQPGRDRYAPFITTPQVYPPDITDVIESQSEILGYSLQNRPIELLTLGSGPDTVLMIASIHGNEDAGTPLVYKLIDRLREQPTLLDGRTVWVMPVANPDGRALRTRGNAAGIDLNRNFPAENRINNAVNGFAGLTEPESSILYDLILARRPARIVTIHQPLYCLDYDGPGEQLARAMAVDCPLPVNKLGSRPGSLGSFAGTEHNIPIITMELAKEDSQLTPNQLWTLYGQALVTAVKGANSATN
ncbi:MAG: M14 family zinc carboxypeptidase [Planctomycetota bacterium]|jgi:protein MpaA